MHSAALRARARTQAEMVRVDGRCAHEQTKRRVRLPKSRSSVEVSVFLKVFMAIQGVPQVHVQLYASRVEP